MAKNPKKRKANPGKGVDFKRVRSKVGKTLPKAQNQTDTTIRSRSINLPGQNIRDNAEIETGSAAVTQRNLSLKDLLSQSSHYSDKVRRDAIAGLKELISSSPEQAQKVPYEILERLSSRMTDSDSEVRRGTVLLMKEAVLPALKECDAGAFLPMVMAHLSSAMSHIADPIREDSLLMLEVLMLWAPGPIVQGYMAPCLAQFNHMLSTSQRSRSVKSQSLSSLLKAATTLHRFLWSAEAASSSAAVPTRESSTGRQSRGAIFSVKSAWPPRSAAPSAGGAEVGKSSKATSEESCRDLTQRLLECYLECAPGHMAMQPELGAALCVGELLGCLKLLLNRLPGGPSAHRVELSLGKKGKRKQVSIEEALVQLVAPHFPVVAVADPSPPADLRAALSWVNIRTSQVLQKLVRSGGGEQWGERLVNYWSGICSHGHVLLYSDELRASQLQADDSTGLATEGCKAALDGCRSTFFDLSPEQRQQLVAAVGDLSERSSPRLQTRRLCLSFQQELLSRAASVPGGLAGVGLHAAGAGAELISEQEVARWLSPLPRMLWELGSTAPDTSRAALQLLLMVGRLARPGGQLMQLLDNLQSQLVPFYVVIRNKKRSSTPSSKKDSQGTYASPGPLVELPAECQSLAVDLLWYFPSLSEATLRAVALIALMRVGRPSKRPTTYPRSLALRAVEIVITRCQQGAGQPHESAAVDLRAYLSFLLSLLMGNARHLRPSEQWPSVSVELTASTSTSQQAAPAGKCAVVEQFWSTHCRIVKVVADCLASSQCTPTAGGTLLSLLAPAIQRELFSSGSSHPGGIRAWYGLLASATCAEPGSSSRGVPAELASVLPGAIVKYSVLCGESNSGRDLCPHPGLGACIALLEKHTSLLRPVLALLESLSTSAERKGFRKRQQQQQAWLPESCPPVMASFSIPQHVQAVASLTAEMFRSSVLKDALLNAEHLLDKTVSALVECAAAVGHETASAAERAAAVATCSELSSVRDSLFGRL